MSLQKRSAVAGETVGSPEEYGAKELKRGYRTRFLIGLTLSIVTHTCLVGTYWIWVRSTPPAAEAKNLFIVRYSELGPPPSIQQTLTSNLRISGLSAQRLNFGTPVPVPDVSLKVDNPFPTQEELSQSGNTTGDGSGGGINIPDSVRAEIPGDDLEGVTPDVNPVLLRMAVPRYPDAAIRGKISGTVWVRVLVDQQGAVKSANVQRSDAPVLNQAALDAARRCTFTPGLYRKRTITAWVSIPIEFKLEQD